MEGGPEGEGDAELFRALVRAGQRLAEIHVHYEQQPEYSLSKKEKEGEKLDWHVTKMRLGKDKATLVYNQFLILSGIPPETYEYRLGNRSALEWVIDQYQVSTDKRSGITNDPNRSDDPQYILRLIGQVVAISLETVKIVKSFPRMGLPGIVRNLRHCFGRLSCWQYASHSSQRTRRRGHPRLGCAGLRSTSAGRSPVTKLCS